MVLKLEVVLYKLNWEQTCFKAYSKCVSFTCFLFTSDGWCNAWVHSKYISKYKYNLNENHQMKFNLWFHSWHWLIFRIIHNWPKFYLDLYCVTLLQIFRQNAQIEHFSHAYHRVLFLACDGKKTRWSECRPGVTSHFRFPVNAIPHWRKKTRWSECRPVLRSAKRAPANIRRLNNRKWRQSYCSVSERSRALALLNAALVWRLIFGVPHYGSYGSL